MNQLKAVCAHLELQIPASAKKAVHIEKISEHLEIENEDNPEPCDTDETWKFRPELERMKLEYAREEREKEREERMERQRLEHELELKKLEYSRENPVVNHEQSSGFNFYTDVKIRWDDVESSLIAFENMADQLKCPLSIGPF